MEELVKKLLLFLLQCIVAFGFGILIMIFYTGIIGVI